MGYTNIAPKTQIQSGEVAGSATAKQLPDISGEMFWLQALSTNGGNVYLGGEGVTIPNGTTDITSGLVLDAGVMIGPLYIDNLNRLYIICDNATDDLLYLVLG